MKLEKIAKNRFYLGEWCHVIVLFKGNTETIVINLGYNPVLAEAMAKDDLDKFVCEFDFSKKMLEMLNEDEKNPTKLVMRHDKITFCYASPLTTCDECELECEIKKILKGETKRD